MAVIDASVYIALINVDEAGHAASWRWYIQTVRSGEHIFAPTIILGEVAAALSRGLNDSDLAHRAVRRLERSRAVELVSVTIILGKAAALVAADHRIKGCDAVYVALAQLRGEYLVTLDRQQLERGSLVVETRQPV
ncbi:MAG TPA: type II toxin-antitoxin system VapC family toxin [Anaerolineae bacterium]|nr:type II toxin-antitoxin system VapC family toxin [Anaerolineae bacterium]